MVYRVLWADTAKLLNLYLTCVHPHLEFNCMLWGPYTYKSISMLEFVQKFACQVCLKWWDMDYGSRLHLRITQLSTHQQYTIKK